MLKKIDFLIIGAMKSATTSLHAYLRSHPEIYMVEKRETGYFLKSDSERRVTGLTNNEIRKNMTDDQLYNLLIQDYKGERLLGERSTDYTKFPYRRVDIERMAGMNAEMKFLYIVRNPLNRILSNYFHFRRYRSTETHPDFNIEIQRQKLYQYFSLYFYQLEYYLKHFPKECFEIVLFDDLKFERDKVLSSVCRFLDIDQTYDFPDLGKHNVNPLKDKHLISGYSRQSYDLLIDPIERDMNSLSEFIGRDLFQIWDVSRENWVN